MSLIVKTLVYSTLYEMESMVDPIYVSAGPHIGRVDEATWGYEMGVSEDWVPYFGVLSYGSYYCI